MLKRLLCLIAAALAAATLTQERSPAATAARAAPAFAPTRFSVTVEGQGPDVIMIPGLMSGRAVWDDAVAGLGGAYRVHRLQIGGFAGEPVGGNAEGPMLAGIVEELHAYIAANRLRRPALVGHSLGGLIAIMLASKYPDDAGSLLVVDALPFYAMMFGPGITAAAVEPRAAAFREALLAMGEDQYRAQQATALASLVRDDKARPRTLAWALASDRAVAARAIYEDMIADMRPALPSLRAPLTIAYAVNQVATEERFGAIVRAGYAGAPGARFEPVADSYHFLMLDQPERFEAILKAFLSRAPRESAEAR